MRAKLSGAVLLLGLLLCSATQAQENGDTLFIQSLQISGTPRRLELETHAGQRLDRARLERDLRRLWATGWFEDIRIEASGLPAGVQLYFRLLEKPRLYLRQVVFEPKSEQRTVGLDAGVAVDAVLAHRVAAALRRGLVEDGYADARVEAELAPAGFQQADLRLRVAPGQRYRVKEVRFSGTPALKPKELQQALRSTRVQRRLPGLPGLWRGWITHPSFSERGLEADLERLRSLYLSRGYFDAEVGLAGVEFEQDDATVRIAVQSGPRYRVRRAKVAGSEPRQELEPFLNGDFPVREMCRCLMKEKRESEQSGQIDFAAQLEIEPAEEPPWAARAGEFAQSLPEEASPQDPFLAQHQWVAITARIETGPAYTVGRIEFLGHHSFSDLTLRRALVLQEGEPFSLGRLRGSLARLNRLGFLEPVTEVEVRVTRDPDGRLHLTIPVEEKPRGRWLLSGPVGPAGVYGPLQFSLGSRLPAWGNGVLELSTYNLTFNLLAFLPSALPTLPLRPTTGLRAFTALERPFLPGQAVKSGFQLSPQLSEREMLASYGLTQARIAVRTALEGDATAGAAVSVPVSWRRSPGEDGSAQAKPTKVLLCEARKPRWAWLRAAGTTAVDWFLGRQLF